MTETDEGIPETPEEIAEYKAIYKKGSQSEREEKVFLNKRNQKIGYSND